jgi:para-aminobenzoate synthetase
MSNGKVLFIDAYDSFSNNIINLLKDRLSVTVESVFIDDPRFVFNDDAFHEHLQQFDAVVAGPGPGHPAIQEDIGLIAKLWTLPDEKSLPVLGICLGFQSLCLAYGGSVGRLTQPRHGLVTPVTHCGDDVYADTGIVQATQYHSLHVQTGLVGDVYSSKDHLWTPTSSCPRLKPLAWDLSDPNNGPIFMAAKHLFKPFRGVQYHPESICTNDEGHKLIDNWWQAARSWNKLNRMPNTTTPASTNGILQRINGHINIPFKRNCLDNTVHWKSFTPSRQADAAAVLQAIRDQSTPFEPLLLESGTRAGGVPVNAETGRFSIIGLQDAASTHVQYSTSTHLLRMTDGSDVAIRKCGNTAEVFSILEELVQNRRASKGPRESPFWGGFVGFVSYEAGLETIDVAPSKDSKERPDVWFVFVERSIVLDHVKGTVYVQSLRRDDAEWLAMTASLISKLSCRDAAVSDREATKAHVKVISEPQQFEYCDKVRTCQSHLRAGSSYELCLTDCTHISSTEDAWSMYLRLRSANPAPFSAFLDLSGANSIQNIKVVGSSPERFLSWSREGDCQFRPIKGTVKKTSTTTRAMAEAQLKTPKEQAENLMIVDLIRHDLSGVHGYVHLLRKFSVELTC